MSHTQHKVHTDTAAPSCAADFILNQLAEPGPTDTDFDRYLFLENLRSLFESLEAFVSVDCAETPGFLTQCLSAYHEKWPACTAQAIRRVQGLNELLCNMLYHRFDILDCLGRIEMILEKEVGDE